MSRPRASRTVENEIRRLGYVHVAGVDEVGRGCLAGPVVAGVVGQERYQFDIWGDTVNVAARLVGLSTPGTVTVTREIFEQVASAFDGESLGELNVKGKGAISVLTLSRRAENNFARGTLVEAP